MKSSYLRRIEGWRGLKIFGDKFLSLDSATCHLVVFIYTSKLKEFNIQKMQFFAERVEQVFIFVSDDDD